MRFLDCIFVKRDWLADKNRILRTFEKFLSHRIPIWLITFVEGTRLTPTKLANSQKHCGRKGLPVLNHVLIPKTRGFTAALEGLEGHLDAVYDVTIGFDGGVPKLSQIYGGLVQKLFIDVRRFPIHELPKSEPDRAEWLKQRFVRKDKILSSFFSTGRFEDRE
jgi:1-acyl-sn-glycerol-3-phosphate acyltransferase